MTDNVSWKAKNQKKPTKTTKIAEIKMTTGSGFAVDKMVEVLKGLGAHEAEE